MATLRIKAEKTGRIRFLSHLESLKMVERSLRRAGVPLKFSQGFNPHPNISFAAPLPVGMSSMYELIDIEVLDFEDLTGLVKNQSEHFPQGFTIVSAAVLDKPKALMKQVALSDYLVTPGQPVDAEEAKSRIKTFMDSESYMVDKKTKKGKWKQVDIRTQVHEFYWDDALGAVFLKLDTGSSSNLKPHVVIREVFGWAEEKMSVCRTRLYRLTDDQYEELS